MTLQVWSNLTKTRLAMDITRLIVSSRSREVVQPCVKLHALHTPHSVSERKNDSC
jgi:hypothetical protein